MLTKNKVPVVSIILILVNLTIYNLSLKLIVKASGNAEFGTIFDATNSFDIFIGSDKEFPMMGLR